MPTTFTITCALAAGDTRPHLFRQPTGLSHPCSQLWDLRNSYLNYLHRTCSHHIHWLARRPGLEPEVSRTKPAGRIRTQTVGLHSPCSPCILFCFSWPLACLQPLQESPGRPSENQVLYQSPCGPVDPHRAREMFCYLIPLHLQSIFTAGIHILPPPRHTSQTPFITLTSHRLPHVLPLHKDLIHNTSEKVARAGYDGLCFKSSTHRR